MGLRFRQVAAHATDLESAGASLGFHVIGSDQGLTTDPVYTTELVFEPGARYDVVINFDQIDLDNGSRVIMENYLGDAPFGGELPGADDIFLDRQTDRIMAFDVIAKASDDTWPSSPLLAGAFSGQFGGAVVAPATRIRKVALFEGKDEFGRLQPLLGTAEPATDYLGNPVNWPNDPKYVAAGLVGQMEGAIAWHSPTTENPALGATEEWEIWNGTGDAHPVHVHLVHFEVLGRQEIVWDSNTIEDGYVGDGTVGELGVEYEEDRVIPNALYGAAAGDGTYKVMQPTVQHNSDPAFPPGSVGSTYGMGFKFQNLTYGPAVATPAGYVENAPKDMVIALPNQVTRIKATFDKPGRYVWHCHILSHEDHEMMRVMHVGPGA
jgi:FtsP/CotA-like multicopper oxidase with cupredoxin domain